MAESDDVSLVVSSQPPEKEEQGGGEGGGGGEDGGDGGGSERDDEGGLTDAQREVLDRCLQALRQAQNDSHTLAALLLVSVCWARV